MQLQKKKKNNTDSVINLITDNISNKYIDTTCLYVCNMQTDNMPDDIYLEMSNEHGKSRILVKFKQLVPIHFCIALIFLNTLIILLFFSLIALFLIKCYHCVVKRYEYNKKLRLIIGVFIGVIFTMITLAVFIYCDIIKIIKILIEIEPKEIKEYWIFFVLVTSTLLTIFIIHEINRIEDKCKECLKKLAASQHPNIHI
jgi:hypothetical protein